MSHQDRRQPLPPDYQFPTRRTEPERVASCVRCGGLLSGFTTLCRACLVADGPNQAVEADCWGV